MLRRLKSLPQHDKILFAHLGFIAESRDQRVLAVLQVISIMDVAVMSRNLRAQPPKLLIVLRTLFAHTRSIDSRGLRSCRILSHRQPVCSSADRARQGQECSRLKPTGRLPSSTTRGCAA